VLVASILGAIIGIMAIISYGYLSNRQSSILLYDFISGFVGGVLPLFVSCGFVIPSIIGLIKK
jgi:hypothetical protein